MQSAACSPLLKTQSFRNSGWDALTARRMEPLQHPSPARCRTHIAHPPPPQWFADFDWDALTARRMEPPRRPQSSDHAKRKAELEDSHKGDPPVPKMSAEEMKEAEVGVAAWRGGLLWSLLTPASLELARSAGCAC